MSHFATIIIALIATVAPAVLVCSTVRGVRRFRELSK